MRYFLEYNEKKKLIGWVAKNVKPSIAGLVEVEPETFKSELAKVGIDYVLESEKINELNNAIFEQALINLDLDFRLTNIELGIE